MARWRFLIGVTVSSFLAACAADYRDRPAAPSPLGADFGNAVRQNEAAHIIDPTPAAADEPAPALDGMRAAAAMTRYQRNAVRELEIERTSDRQSE